MPNFGCCAANMHSGFPNFARNIKKLQSIPFASASIEVTVLARKIKNWHLKKGSAKLPSQPIVGDETTLTLVPYGFTNLRVSHYPDLR